MARNLAVLALGLCALIPGRAAYPNHGNDRAPETTEGRLATKIGKRVVDVPLEHTEVTIHATGHLAEVSVEQRFKNPYDKKIEAVYLFPLPTGAAVNDLAIEIGDRVIHGEIAKRDEAKATYVKAKKAGFVAALLTQERPNLFTQNVANLEPGAVVTVKMTYLEPLVYSDGGYEIVFPMVAPPRYLPATSNQAADADAVQPAVLPPETRSSHDINVTVDIDAGVAIRAVASSSHQIVQTAGATAAEAHVTLAPGDTIPNKDFVLRYAVAGEQPEVAVMADRSGENGSFFLTIQPPAAANAGDIAPRELVFVVDTSSSMRGAPLAKARELIHAMLGTLAPDDTFQIVRFADTSAALGDKPIANKPKNIEYALAWLDALDAAGGTAMTEGIAAALDVPHDPLRLRLVVFLTDGYVGNEDEILATVHAKLGASRLYSFGVGTAVNRYLLEEMASFGKGAAQIVRPDEDTAAAVATFHDRIAKPVVTDVAIDWGGLAVADVTPAAIPDLFVGQPIVVAGHYAAAGTGTVTITGKAGGRDVSFTAAVDLPAAAADRPAIATVWARARIAELTRAEIRGATDATRDEITKLALEHHLMSRYTAFVAVDRSRVTAGGDATRVAVPVEVPDGLHPTSGGGWTSGGMGAGYGGGYGAVGAVGTIAHADYAPLAAPMYDEAPAEYFESNVQSIETVAAKPKAEVVERALDMAGHGESADVRDDAAVMYDAATAHKAEITKLFKAALKTDPAIAGAYKFKLTIGLDGTVTSVVIVTRPDKAGAEDFAIKVKQAMAKWTFAKPSGSDPVEVVLPLVLVDK